MSEHVVSGKMRDEGSSCGQTHMLRRGKGFRNGGNDGAGKRRDFDARGGAHHAFTSCRIHGESSRSLVNALSVMIFLCSFVLS